MKITQKQLSAWNVRKVRLGDISANENVNVANGLPGPEERRLLSKVHASNFGISNPVGKVTMQMVKDYLEIHGSK